MEAWVIGIASIGLSLLGSAVVCALTFGRLQGKVEGMNYRLDKIEREHSTVMTGLSDVQARVEEGNKVLLHLQMRMDQVVNKTDMVRIEQRLDLAISGKVTRSVE